MAKHPNDRKAVGLILLAGLIFFLLSQFHIGRLIQWPFVIVTTFVHELGHGLTGILVGGEFIKMEIFRNASGLAFIQGTSAGLPQALVAAGGLIAPSLCAGLLILIGRSRIGSSRLLIGFSLIILLSCAIWVRTAFGLMVLMSFAGFFLVLSQKAKGAFDQFFVQFMGMHMVVDTFTRTLGYLFVSEVKLGASDTARIAENLGGSYLIWALLIATSCGLILYFSLRRAYFR